MHQTNLLAACDAPEIVTIRISRDGQTGQAEIISGTERALAVYQSPTSETAYLVHAATGLIVMNFPSADLAFAAVRKMFLHLDEAERHALTQQDDRWGLPVIWYTWLERVSRAGSLQPIPTNWTLRP